MAKSVNKVILLGNVGKDPEIRSTGGGTMVANFTLATSDRQKDAQGNWQDRTEWHNMVAFTRLAEIVRDYVKKGSKLYVEGKIQTRSWDDKETGVKKYRTEIIVNDLSLLSGREDGGIEFRWIQPSIRPGDYRRPAPRRRPRRIQPVRRNLRRRHTVLNPSAAASNHRTAPPGRFTAFPCKPRFPLETAPARSSASMPSPPLVPDRSTCAA